MDSDTKSKMTLYEIPYSHENTDHHRLPDSVRWPPDTQLNPIDLRDKETVVPSEKIQEPRSTMKSHNKTMFSDNSQVESSNTERCASDYYNLFDHRFSLAKSILDFKSCPLSSLEPNIVPKVIEFFSDNEFKDRNDFNLDALADRFETSRGQMAELLIDILSSILAEGLSMEYDGEYDPEQLKMGIEVEMEHTTNRKIAEKIAKDHLAEIPDYYTRLKEMERSAESK